jgi:hypothetical protein
MRILLASLLLSSALLTNAALAAKFANPFTEFEMPPQWSCNLEGAEWVCQSSNGDKRGEAIMVVLAKIRGADDNIASYLAYLKAAKSYNAPNGKSAKSDPIYAKSIQVANQEWVDALQKDSEIPGFQTRYFATIKEDIGVLVSISVLKEKYAAYLPQIDDMVKTFKVFRKKDSAPPPSNSGSILDMSKVPNMPTDSTVFGQAGTNQQIQGGGAGGKKPAGGGEGGLGLLALVGAGAVGFLVWRKKRSED